MSPNNGSSPLFSRKLQLQTGNTSTIFKLSVVATAAILSRSAAAQNPANVEDADNSIELKDTYVRPDYVEIERMRDTKGSSSKPPSLNDGGADLFKRVTFDQVLKSVESSRER